MASTLAVLLLLSAGLFTVKAGLSEDCKSYYTISGEYKRGFKCLLQYCCGSCNDKYCCSSEHLKLTESIQSLCDIGSGALIVVLGIVGFLFNIIVIVICCCCPCCCIYKMCRKPRPVVGAHVTAVTNTNVIQQQSAVQPIQYPQYQPVPTQMGYGQPMQMGPYQGQPYAPGPPPSYHIATGPGYLPSQNAYDGGQAMYPTQPSAETDQPAYNPAYGQPPKTGY